MCKLCNTKHWSSEPHELSGSDIEARGYESRLQKPQKRVKASKPRSPDDSEVTVDEGNKNGVAIAQTMIEPEPSIEEVNLGASTREAIEVKADGVTDDTKAIQQVLDKPLTQAERNQRWRDKNRKKYNAYMRGLRRKGKE